MSITYQEGLLDNQYLEENEKQLHLANLLDFQFTNSTVGIRTKDILESMDTKYKECCCSSKAILYFKTSSENIFKKSTPNILTICLSV